MPLVSDLCEAGLVGRLLGWTRPGPTALYVSSLLLGWGSFLTREAGPILPEAGNDFL